MTLLKPFLAPTLAFAAYLAVIFAAPFALADQAGTDDPAVPTETVEEITDQDVDGDGCIMENGACVAAGGD